jgi:DNA-binding beta-propeller fold protein YncE
MKICQQCWAIFIDMNNTLYCSLSERHQIIAKSLNNNSNQLTIVGGTGTASSMSNMLHNPRGIFVDITFDLYVADCGNDRTQLFLSGKLSAVTIAGNGSLNITIPLNCPTDIILDGDRYLFIVDSGNHRIIGSGPSGFRCLVGCSGSSGSSPNQLYKPWALSFDSYGNIFVTDQGNSRIQKFNLMPVSCGKFNKM